jgi:hypothetical protein
MTVTEPTDPTPAPAIRHAFRHIGNRGRTSPRCLCGHCLADEEYSDTELALDACVTQIRNMVEVMATFTPKAHATTGLSLRVLYELIDDARKLLCVQRQTTRALASHRAR